MNKKWASKRITLNLAAIEAEKLQKYCNETGRPATDVIRELVRGLPMPSASSDATVKAAKSVYAIYTFDI